MRVVTSYRLKIFYRHLFFKGKIEFFESIFSRKKKKSICFLQKIRAIHQKAKHLQAKYFWLKVLIWRAAAAPLGRMAAWCFIFHALCDGAHKCPSLLPYMAVLRWGREPLWPNGCSMWQQCCVKQNLDASCFLSPRVRQGPTASKPGRCGCSGSLGARIGLSRALILMQHHSDVPDHLSLPFTWLEGYF